MTQTPVNGPLKRVAERVPCVARGMVLEHMPLRSVGIVAEHDANFPGMVVGVLHCDQRSDLRRFEPEERLRSRCVCP